MTMKRFHKMLLFDIDGTLLLSGGGGAIAFEKAFEELFGIPQAWQDVIPDGKTDRIIFEEISERCLGRPLKEHEYKRLCESYLRYFRKTILESKRFRLLPGIPQLFQALARRRDIVNGLATGNLEEAAWLKLQRAGLQGYFQFGGFGSDSPDRLSLTRKALERGQTLTGGPIPPERIFLIGDTAHDIAAGKELGIRTIAVATGRTSLEVLHTHSPDFLYKDLSDQKLFFAAIDAPQKRLSKFVKPIPGG